MRKLSFLVAMFMVVACGGLVSGSDGGAGSDAGGVSDAAQACVLKASSYVTSCNADTDCVTVWLGDACSSQCFCPNAAINASSKSQYDADFAATKHGGSICDCPAFPPSTCCGGTCTLAFGTCDAGH